MTTRFPTLFHRSSRAPIVALLLIILAGTLIAQTQLFTRPPDIDEFFSYLQAEGIAKHGLPILPSEKRYSRGILAGYINAAATLLLDHSVHSMRVVSLAFFALVSLLTYLLANRTVGWKTALLAVIWLNLLPIEQFFATNARMYMQLQFFFLLTLYFFYLGFEEDRRNYKYLVTVPFVAGLLTHPLILMFLPPAALYLLLTKEGAFFRNRHNIIGLSALFLAATLTGPALRFVLNALYPMEDMTLPEGYAWDLEIGFRLNNFRLLWLMVTLANELPLTLTLLTIGVLFLIRDKENRVLLLFYLMTIIPTFISLFYINQQKFRYFFELIPIYIIISATILGQLIRHVHTAHLINRLQVWCSAKQRLTD